MNVLLPFVPTTQFASTHPEAMIADVDQDILEIHSPNVPKKMKEQLLLLVHATALVQERVNALKGSPFGQLHRNVPGAFWH